MSRLCWELLRKATVTFSIIIKSSMADRSDKVIFWDHVEPYFWFVLYVHWYSPLHDILRKLAVHVELSVTPVYGLWNSAVDVVEVEVVDSHGDGRDEGAANYKTHSLYMYTVLFVNFILGLKFCRFYFQWKSNLQSELIT